MYDSIYDYCAKFCENNIENNIFLLYNVTEFTLVDDCKLLCASLYYYL